MRLEPVRAEAFLTCGFSATAFNFSVKIVCISFDRGWLTQIASAGLSSKKCFMKIKLTPLHHLWILFSLQVTVLLVLLVMFVFFEPRFSHLIRQNQDSDAKVPLIKQRLDEADPDRLHKDALILLDSSSTQSKFVQEMEINVIHLLGLACFLVFVLTSWLGIAAFHLQRASRVGGKSL